MGKGKNVSCYKLRMHVTNTVEKDLVGVSPRRVLL